MKKKIKNSKINLKIVIKNKENKNKTTKKRPNKFLNSISNILFNDNLYSQFGPQPLKFVCMNCGKEHNERTCPVCGSNAVRLG